MKLTIKRLKQMILETMYTPFNIVDVAMDDPDIPEKLKVLLSSKSEYDVNQAIELIRALYPHKYDKGDIEDKLAIGKQVYDQLTKGDNMGDKYTKTDSFVEPVTTTDAYRHEFENQVDFRKLSDKIVQYGYRYKLLYNMRTLIKADPSTVNISGYSHLIDADESEYIQNFPQDKYLKVTLVEIGKTFDRDKVTNNTGLSAISDIVSKLKKDGLDIQSLRSPKIQQELDMTPFQIMNIERKRGFYFHEDILPKEAVGAQTSYRRKHKSIYGVSFYINKETSRGFGPVGNR
jgi:hypothetical protein